MVPRSLTALKWLAIVLPALFLILLEQLRHLYFAQLFTPWMGRIIVLAVMVIGVFIFSHAVFGLLKRMQRELLQRNRHLTATNEILSAFGRSRDVEQVIGFALERLMEVVQVEFGSICFLDERRRELVALASRGLPPEMANQMERMKLGGLEAEVSREGVPKVIHDVSTEPGVMDGIKMLGVRSLILLPLTSKGAVRGMAFIGNRHRRVFSPLDVQLLTATGSQIAMALENSWLFNETQEQSDRLQILHGLGIDLAAELSLEALLQKVVNASRDLVRARYGALRVLEGDGRPHRFLTSGVSDEDAARIGAPPKGLGLLGRVVGDGTAIRTADIAGHPDSVGFPSHHPVMRNFLGVPIVSRGSAIGSLYLADKEGDDEFTQAEEDILTMLAAHAAVAIDNARLYGQVQDLTRLQERERIAMDLHDGVIQSIYAAGLTLESCLDAFEGSPPEMRQRLGKAVDRLNDVIREIRMYILDLRPGPSRTKTLRQILEDAVRELRVTALIEAEVAADGLPEELPEGLGVQLSYIVREAVANIIKHAQARRVTFGLASDDDGYVLSIRDDGVGFLTGRPAGSGQGLRNMAQRAGEMRGRLSVESAPGMGTEVVVAFPRRRSAQEVRRG